MNGFYRGQSDSIDSSGPLDDFGVFDLTASYQLTESLRIYGRVENAFNEDYQEIADYNPARRGFYFGIRLSF